MSDPLRDLYQEVVIDHGKNPRNFRPLDDATHRARGVNPLCGDRIELAARLDGDRLEDLAFQGDGCTIARASASLLTSLLRGRTRAEAEALAERLHAALTAGGPADDLGKLAVLLGVREFPVRVKCATLAWHVLRAALAGQAEPVSTE